MPEPRRIASNGAFATSADEEFTARCYKCQKEWPVTKATLVKDGVPDLGPASGWLIKCPTCGEFSPVRKPGTPFPTTMPR